MILLLIVLGCSEHAKCLPRSDIQSPASCEDEKGPSEQNLPVQNLRLTYKRVLIHSASGGVGIAAIQLCKYIGVKASFITLSVDSH